jgi:hypothetical protein
MTASSARTRLVLLQAAARPSAETAGPREAKIRRYRIARAHLQAQRNQSLAVATQALKNRALT